MKPIDESLLYDHLPHSRGGLWIRFGTSQLLRTLITVKPL
jgi:hypothetical protein